MNYQKIIFQKKFEKKYDSFAFTTIEHIKLKPNNEATQIFTNEGSYGLFTTLQIIKLQIVYSMRIKMANRIQINKIINKFNPNFKIKKINKISKFDLKSINLREYYKDNILAFGDLLHKLHPLAGQGFNMSIRDIKKLLDVINNKDETRISS